MSQYRYEIFAISESRLHDCILDSEIEIRGYNIYRRDRPNSRGGGVYVYVTDCYDFSLCPELMFENVETLWGKMSHDKNTFSICVLYRSPSENDSYFNDILDMIEKATVNGQDCILLGDGDLNYDYDINESLHKNPIHYIESLYGMTQLITDKTRVTECSETLLDVILTTNPELHRVCGVVTKTLSDHYMIYTELIFPKNTMNATHNVVTLKILRKIVVSMIWYQRNEVLAKSQGDVSWNEWKNQFLLISNMHAPIKTARMKSRANPWITREVINHMYERDKIHERAIWSGDPVLMDHYRKLRNNVIEMIKQNKKKYFQDIDNASRSNPRKFWSELTNVIPKSIKDQFPKLWRQMSLTFSSRVFLTK